MTLEETKATASEFLDYVKALECGISLEYEKQRIVDFYQTVIDHCNYIERVSNPSPIPREMLND